MGRLLFEFEFDLVKSRANEAKHGIDFVAAQDLWVDEELVEVPARTEDEPRFLVVGRIAGKHWSAIVTYRENRIRLISVRRARPEEVAIYEGQGAG
ncbi:MAG TPA: BrnT family toxin [Thermoanaerobaculia bacterium]|nr:BrnT family toxin [Thermoanaerobaculia bacterium]